MRSGLLAIVLGAVAAFVAVVVYSMSPIGSGSTSARKPSSAGTSPKATASATRSPAVSPFSEPSHAATDPAPRFDDVAGFVGMNFTYFPDARVDRMFLPENMGGGAGWLDVDGDGLLDLFLTNGCRLPRDAKDRTYTQELFRQSPDGQFVSIAALAGVDLNVYGQGCVVGDADGDGFADLYLTCYGENVLLQNNGDGTFRDRTEAAALADPGWSTSAAFGDIDRDGDLDLYVAHYALTTIESNPVCTYEEGKIRGFCGPLHYTAEPDSLFLNQGDGTFRQVGPELNIEPAPGHGLGVVTADLDNDQWPDIYVANDLDANFLLHNRGTTSGELVLEEIGVRSGSALSSDGKPEASMGIACADFDDDGHFDLFLTHYYREKNTYYANHGAMRFDDMSYPSGLGAPSLPFLGFGVVPIDYDLDGKQDLVVTNGHVLGKLLRPYAMRPQLFRNVGGAKFREVTKLASAYFFQEWIGRGMASADYDNDGDEDVVIVHHDDRATALLNNSSQRAGSVIGLEFSGTASNRDGFGTRVEIRSGDSWIHRELVGGGSYLSASDLRMLVGLASKPSAVDLVVRWPSGLIQEIHQLQPGYYWSIREGSPPRKKIHTIMPGDSWGDLAR